MKALALLVIHVLTTLAQLAGPGGTRAIIAESVLIKHQQLIARRSVGKTPRLTTSDRFLCGFLVQFMHPSRIRKAAVVLKPATLTKLRRVLLSHNYHRLFSSRKNRKPGPKGPSDDLVRAIVELKRRNPRFGCPKIAQHINKAFGVNIDKDVARRVLAKRYRPEPYGGGPSWLTFFRHINESLLSTSLFRNKSILPKFLSILAAISEHTRRIIGCGIAGCHFDQTMLCSLFAAGIPVVKALTLLGPTRKKFLGVGRTQTGPIFPRAPPFAERRIGTSRPNHHDYRSSCGAIDLEREHGALYNNHNLFLIPGPLNENRFAKINAETALNRAERQNFTRKGTFEKNCGP